MWESVFGWLAAGAGLLAAVMWLLASLVRVPPFPDVGFDSTSEVFEPVRQALAKGSSRNAWAAGVTAGAVLLQAAALAAHRLGA